MSQRSLADFLALAGWRRTTAEMYAAVRRADNSELAWQQLIATREHLFKTHPQSPLAAEERAAFSHLSYYSYDPAFRVTGTVDDGPRHGDADASERTIELAEDGLFRYRRIGDVHFELKGEPAQLSLFWIQGYGGGLFLPFKDSTNKSDTFGGGRYLYDTIKGADLGAGERSIILDFNFAYNPSCAYDARWVCPLSPPENTLHLSITAGEKRFTLP